MYRLSCWKSPAVFGISAAMADAPETTPLPSPFGSGLPSEGLTAHLTGKPGVQRVPSPKLTLFLRRRFLDPETCAAVIARIDSTRRPSGVDYQRYCGVAGNRTWTVMIYLNEPEAGGATRFKAIDKIVQPETGKLLAWNNRRPDGSLNPATIHQGMKVRSGVKYVITKWFREKPWGWA
jgi:hypothetical protein